MLRLGHFPFTVICSVPKYVTTIWMKINETGIFGEWAQFEIHVTKKSYRLNKGERYINYVETVVLN